jgi:hypothetical protein
MKQLFILLASTFLYVGASAQNLWKSPVLPEIEVEAVEPEPIHSDTTIYNQFRDYVEFQQAQEEKRGLHRPVPQPLFIRPKQVIRKRDEVVVIYDRRDFERLEHYKRWQMMKMRERRPDWKK